MYFSDRELGPRARTEDMITELAWGGVVVTIQSFITHGSFGAVYPLECQDGLGSYGTHSYMMGIAVKSEIPEIEWPLRPDELPPTLAVLDLIEFCYHAAAKPVQRDFHEYFKHYHLEFDQQEGRKEFRDRINRILIHNGLAYQLEASGQILRLAPAVLREELGNAVFKTGDTVLDQLLEVARQKFLAPNEAVRRESLEKLWDAWERVKTIKPGKDKKTSVSTLLDATASEPNFRELLEREAKELTDTGNTFQIRHSETSQVQLQESRHVDYLFHRLFAMIQLLIHNGRS